MKLLDLNKNKAIALVYVATGSVSSPGSFRKEF